MNNQINNENRTEFETQTQLPIIFKNKVNLKHKVIPLNVITNTIGLTRFFPPATNEWFNSIYAYNLNSTKNLPAADKMLSKLIKSYFRFYFNNKILKSKKIPMRFRKVSLKKIFISKAELKHTNEKVVITLYVYNEEKRHLTLKLKNLERLFKPKFKGSINSRLLLYVDKFKKSVPLMEALKEVKSAIFESKLQLESKTQKARTRKSNVSSINLDSKLKVVNEMILLSKESKNVSEKLDRLYTKVIIKNLFYNEVKEIASCKLLLDLNKSKFEDAFLFKLKELVCQIYGKEVEFNIVNLKNLYFNSDIFTEAIALKVKNRKLRLLKILKASLGLVKLPSVNLVTERTKNSDVLPLDHLKNVHLNSVIEGNQHPVELTQKNNDVLDQLLLKVLPNSTFDTKLPLGSSEESHLLENISTRGGVFHSYDENFTEINNPLNLVISNLKYKKLAGVRLEAKGRLTKRFTASRSVFKVKWKGSIKNLDSSYKNIPSVLLRGHAKSNVQYTLVNSKTRNGSFGLKGWISSK